MSHVIRIRPEAERDIAEARMWYESKREGLGDAFLLSVEDGLERAAALPESHRAVHRDVRRVLLRRFPYAIFYRLRSDILIVIAIMHTSRDPQRWQERT